MSKTRRAAAWLFTFCCILVNLGGKTLAVRLNLPVWLDTLGTAAVAYACGPVYAAASGAATVGAASLIWKTSAAYALPHAAVGILLGVCARKKMLRTPFGIFTVGILAASAATVISAPLNWLIQGGHTGNVWGDGVVDFLDSLYWSGPVCTLIGSFYVYFADQLLTVLLLNIGLLICRRLPHRAAATLCVLALLCAALPAAAQGEGPDYSAYLHTVYNHQDGLPGGTANDIAQTQDGVLWIGTYGGLYRYTGKDFQLMSEFDSVKNVNCFCVDDRGRLWIGTNDNGLSVCRDNAILAVLSEEQGLPSDSVRFIAQGPEYFYVGTSSALAIVTLGEELALKEVIPEIVYAESVSVSGGYAAAVTDEGGLFLLKGSQVLDRVLCPAGGMTFSCCAYDGTGQLYAGTTGGAIYTFATRDDRLERQAQISCGTLSQINSLEFTDSGEILICADNGVGYIDASGVCREINTDSFNSSIDRMTFDYQGNLWFTSSRLGLLKLSQSPFTEIYRILGMPERVVNTVLRWQGNLYFGTDSRLDAVDGAMTRQVHNSITQALQGVRIRCLMEDSGGGLWICTSGKGAYHVRSEEEFTVYDSGRGALGDKFRCALEADNGEILLAGDQGITYIQRGEVIKTVGFEDGLETPKVLCLSQTSRGDILAGTDGNGIAVLRDGVVVDTIEKSDGLSSNVIMRIAPDLDGAGFFVVTGNGLCYMSDGDGSHGGYKPHVLGNFPYFNNYDVIQRKDGTVFVLCSGGIYVVEKQALLSGERLECTLLNYAGGMRPILTANSWNYVDEEENLYFSADSGAVKLDLHHYTSSQRTYQMGLKAVEIDGESYAIIPGEPIHIPRQANRLTVTPEIINYSVQNPDIRVWMEGFDREPGVVPLSELSELSYTGLPTGEFTFRLEALDDSGQVAAGRAYQVIKEKAIYDEPYFHVYLVAVQALVLLYLVLLLFKIHMNRAFREQRIELDAARRQVEMANEAIMTIAQTVDAKDPNTSQHSIRVSEYSVMIARRLGYTEEQCEKLRKIALLHDIGKVGVPDSVLNKPGKLTPEEYEVMKTHVTKGAEILRNFTALENIVQGAQYHHERYDGTGYTQGLKGEEIPLNARIIGIADAFDAMTTSRVYRKQRDLGYVIAELKQCSGTQFDPRMVKIMMELIEDGTIPVLSLYPPRTVLPITRQERDTAQTGVLQKEKQ